MKLNEADEMKSRQKPESRANVLGALNPVECRDIFAKISEECHEILIRGRGQKSAGGPREAGIHAGLPAPPRGASRPLPSRDGARGELTQNAVEAEQRNFLCEGLPACGSWLAAVNRGER